MRSKDYQRGLRKRILSDTHSVFITDSLVRLSPSLPRPLKDSWHRLPTAVPCSWIWSRRTISLLSRLMDTYAGYRAAERRNDDAVVVVLEFEWKGGIVSWSTWWRWDRPWCFSEGVWRPWCVWFLLLAWPCFLWPFQGTCCVCRLQTPWTHSLIISWTSRSRSGS